jgi:hypothetical protein
MLPDTRPYVRERWGKRLTMASADEFAVLGVDLASKRWRDVGSALLSFQAGPAHDCLRVVPNAISWPSKVVLTPTAVADAIDEFAREHQVVAVSLDGPQGWRDPNATPTQGVGRACEQSARTPGKTGTYGRTFPTNQLGWISFSIEVFDRLLEHAPNRLVNSPGRLSLRRGDYHVLECFPTVTWRSGGLESLPAKSKHPHVRTFAAALARRWRLPSFVSTLGHDDLQAVVAALPAAALLGAGTPITHGVSAHVLPANRKIPEHRVEGIIWDARP